MQRCTAHCHHFSASRNRLKASMADAFDLVILGGGCAGLSLSSALAAQGARCPLTLVLESRAEYTNDRTWCFWSETSKPMPFEIEHRWQTMRVSFAGQSVSLACGSTPYHMLAAGDFYAAAQCAIDRQPNITLQRGMPVPGEPAFRDGMWHIGTSRGEVRARSVVDTRASVLPRRDGATLWQSFYGQEIECSAPVFDPSAVHLMDFLAPEPLHVPFVYVLPVTPTRALIEVTVFGASPLSPRELVERLQAAIASRLGGAPFKTLRREHGILPMGLTESPSPAHERYVRVGVMAGGARPGTGYAFQRIQRWADECADALALRGHPIGHAPDPLPLRVMDQIFLNVLRADPDRGGALFFSLFSRADPARVIRFLSGNAGIVDSLAVVAALPVPPFARAALAMTRRRGRIDTIEGLA
jgi:lycopene beta-cyclase